MKEERLLYEEWSRVITGLDDDTREALASFNELTLRLLDLCEDKDDAIKILRNQNRMLRELPEVKYER